jgi:hypothetical protein
MVDITKKITLKSNLEKQGIRVWTEFKRFEAQSSYESGNEELYVYSKKGNEFFGAL